MPWKILATLSFEHQWSQEAPAQASALRGWPAAQLWGRPACTPFPLSHACGRPWGPSRPISNRLCAAQPLTVTREGQLVVADHRASSWPRQRVNPPILQPDHADDVFPLFLISLLSLSLVSLTLSIHLALCFSWSLFPTFSFSLFLSPSVFFPCPPFFPP